MSDTGIAALRQKLANRVRSDDYRQRRKDMDAGFLLCPRDDGGLNRPLRSFLLFFAP